MSDARARPEPDAPLTELGTRAWAESLNVAFELAVAGAEARYGMDRDRAIAWLADIFRDEDERNLPAVVRMARGKPDVG